MNAPLTRDEALDLVGKRLTLLGFPGWIEVQPTITRAIIVMLVAHAGLDHAVMEIEAAIDYDNAELQASHDEAERLIPGGSGVSEASLEELEKKLTNGGTNWKKTKEGIPSQPLEELEKRIADELGEDLTK